MYYLAFDTETTGLADDSKLLTACFILFDSSNSASVTNCYNSPIGVDFVAKEIGTLLAGGVCYNRDLA